MFDAGLPSEQRFGNALVAALARRSIELSRVSNRFQLESVVDHEPIDGVLLVDTASDSTADSCAALAAWLRERKPLSTLIVLMASGTSPAQCVAWFDADVDDCMARPIEVEEAAARLAAALRRRGRLLPQRDLRHGDLTLDVVDAMVAWRNAVVKLTPQEAVVLRALIEQAGRVVSREALHRALHGDGDVRGNTVEVYVHSLRHKLQPSLIRTVRGAGYRLVDIASTPSTPDAASKAPVGRRRTS